MIKDSLKIQSLTIHNEIRG